jgi:hypothetical protein
MFFLHSHDSQYFNYIWISEISDITGITGITGILERDYIFISSHDSQYIISYTIISGIYGIIRILEIIFLYLLMTLIISHIGISYIIYF